MCLCVFALHGECMYHQKVVRVSGKVNKLRLERGKPDHENGGGGDLRLGRGEAETGGVLRLGGVVPKT